MQIRQFTNGDTDAVIALWAACDLIRSWNDPIADIRRKQDYQADLFFVGDMGDELIASAMFGYEGHRGWVNYLAVSPLHQRKGYAKALMHYGEAALHAIGCPKLNLQIRRENSAVAQFYAAIGYIEDDVLSYGKRLIADK